MSTAPQSHDPEDLVALSDTIAGRFANWAIALRLEDVPREVLAHARRCLLDGVGIALASSRYEFAQRAVVGLASVAGAGESPIIGTTLRLAPRDAMLLNGVLVHGLDFDDTHAASVVHGTASALPCMLANALAQQASGAHALMAYLVAMEVSARLGAVAKGRFQQRGHHPTGMIGAYGATLCAGRLTGLSATQLERAQGITLSMASGSLEFLQDGDWTKRLHPGWAAVSGTTAAALAGGDFLGPVRAYEGRYGLFNLHLGADHGLDLSALGADLGSTWEMPNVAFKPYPACHFNHAFIDAMLALRSAHAPAPENVERIVVRLHPRQVEVVCEPLANKRRPSGDYDAKFSLPFAVAVALLRGRFTLGDLDRATREDPQVLAMADRVDYEIDPRSAYPASYSGEVELTLRSGERITQRQDVNRGARDNPLSDEEIDAKFYANAERCFDRPRAERVRDLILTLEHQPDLSALAGALMSGA